MSRPLRRRLRDLRARTAAGARGARVDDAGLVPGARYDPHAPGLVLSPHWDDAVLGCWSVLEGDTDLTVVNVFGGLPQKGTRGTWELVAGFADSRERALARIEEDRHALALAGREPRQLSLQEVRARGRARIGASDIDRAVTECVVSASRVYAPAGIGGHVDHLLTRAYARALAASGMPVTLYAELPYCIFHGWPAWVQQEEPDPRRDAQAYWQSFLGDVPELGPLEQGTVIHLEPEQAARRLEAIDRYRVSLNHSVRRMLAWPGFHSIDVSWPLTGGPPGTDRDSR